MFRFVMCVAIALVTLTSTVHAQNQATAFSHGPTIPMYSIGFDDNGDAIASMLDAGAGYSFNFNLFPSMDGNVRHATIGIPFFVSLPEQGEFRFAIGATLGTFNNLISVGAAVDLVNTIGMDTGALLGDFEKRNLKLLLNFGLNFGSGAPPPASAQKAGTAVSADPPPGYVGW